MEAVLTATGERIRLGIEARGLPWTGYAEKGNGWQAYAEDLQAHIEGRKPSNWSDRSREQSAAHESSPQLAPMPVPVLNLAMKTVNIHEKGKQWACQR